MSWSAEKSGFRTCTVLLKCQLWTWGHISRWKERHKHAQASWKGICVSRSANNLEAHNQNTKTQTLCTLHSSVCVYCTCCLSVTCTVCMSSLEKSVHESPLSLAQGSAASQLKEGCMFYFSPTNMPWRHHYLETCCIPELLLFKMAQWIWIT